MLSRVTLRSLLEKRRPPRPTTPEDEHLYRCHVLGQDTARAVLVFGSFLLQGVAFVFADHRLLGSGPIFSALLASRVALGIVCLAATVAVLRSRSPRVHDAASVIVALAMALQSSALLATRPPDYVGHATPGIVLINILYLVMPGPLWARAAGAVMYSIASFLFVERSLVAPLLYNAAVTAHVFSHVVGLPIGRWVEVMRRDGFFAQLDERRAREELAQKAADLEVARRQAESFATAKSEFLTTMSHELRTPMNAVLGLSDVLATTPLAADQRELVGIIHRSAESLLRVLNDILDLAKVEAGRMTIDRAPFDVRDVVQGVVDILAHTAAEKGLSLGIAVAPDVPPGVLGDAARLRQILVNLVSNAVKFTDEGKVEVRVTMRAGESGSPAAGESGSPVGSESNSPVAGESDSPLGAESGLAPAEPTLVIAVQDTGAGIPPDVLGRLFTPFEQGDAAGSERRRGSGLGLAISKRIVERMGGGIRVDTEVGRGSSFEIWIPAPPSPAPVPEVRSVPPMDAQIRPLAILLVEDNPVNQRVAQAMLGWIGQRADVAENGLVALEAASQKPYDVVLMDLLMPRMGGVEAARRLRAEPPPGGRPYIIAMTASAFEEDRRACSDAGMDDYLSKPVQLADLAEALRRAAAALAVEAPISSVEPAAVLARGPLDQLRKLAALHDPGVLGAICREFVTGAARYLDEWSAALAAGDAQTAERLAHSLKSMSGTVGAARMSDRCRELEVSARSGDLAAHPAALEELRAELARVARALESEVGEPLQLAAG